MRTLLAALIIFNAFGIITALTLLLLNNAVWFLPVALITGISSLILLSLSLANLIMRLDDYLTHKLQQRLNRKFNDGVKNEQTN